MSISYRNIVPIWGTKTHKYSIIIPAAGMGIRMKSYGVKSLIQLTPKINLITHQLEIIRRTFANCEIILVTGFEAERLMDQTPNDIIKIYNESFEETNVTWSIGLGLRAATTDNIIIIYGDLVFNDKALRITLKESALVAGNNIMSDNEIGCRCNNGMVEFLTYNTTPKWAQITYTIDFELDLLKKYCWDPNNKKLYGFEIINKIIENGGKFKIIQPPKIKANDIDSSKDLLTIKRII